MMKYHMYLIHSEPHQMVRNMPNPKMTTARTIGSHAPGNLRSAELTKSVTLRIRSRVTVGTVKMTMSMTPPYSIVDLVFPQYVVSAVRAT